MFLRWYCKRTVEWHFSIKHHENWPAHMLAAGTREMFPMCCHEIYSYWCIIQKLKLVRLALVGTRLQWARSDWINTYRSYNYYFNIRSGYISLKLPNAVVMNQWQNFPLRRYHSRMFSCFGRNYPKGTFWKSWLEDWKMNRTIFIVSVASYNWSTGQQWVVCEQICGCSFTAEFSSLILVPDY